MAEAVLSRESGGEVGGELLQLAMANVLAGRDIGESLDLVAASSRQLGMRRLKKPGPEGDILWYCMKLAGRVWLAEGWMATLAIDVGLLRLENAGRHIGLLLRDCGWFQFQIPMGSSTLSSFNRGSGLGYSRSSVRRSATCMRQTCGDAGASIHPESTEVDNRDSIRGAITESVQLSELPQIPRIPR